MAPDSRLSVHQRVQVLQQLEQGARWLNKLASWLGEQGAESEGDMIDQAAGTCWPPRSCWSARSGRSSRRSGGQSPTSSSNSVPMARISAGQRTGSGQRIRRVVSQTGHQPAPGAGSYKCNFRGLPGGDAGTPRSEAASVPNLEHAASRLAEAATGTPRRGLVPISTSRAWRPVGHLTHSPYPEAAARGFTKRLPARCVRPGWRLPGA